MNIDELKQHIKKRMNYLLDNDAGEFEWCDEYAEVEYITLHNVLDLIENGMYDYFSWGIKVGVDCE